MAKSPGLSFMELFPIGDTGPEVSGNELNTTGFLILNLGTYNIVKR